jgi:hypothetical protein
MIIDGDTLDPRSANKVLIGVILPKATQSHRFIGWVSTVSTDGLANLASVFCFRTCTRPSIPRAGGLPAPAA